MKPLNESQHLRQHVSVNSRPWTLVGERTRALVAHVLRYARIIEHSAISHPGRERLQGATLLNHVVIFRPLLFEFTSEINFERVAEDARSSQCQNLTTRALAAGTVWTGTRTD